MYVQSTLAFKLTVFVHIFTMIVYIEINKIINNSQTTGSINVFQCIILMNLSLDPNS
jgi:hypothetical protein